MLTKSLAAAPALALLLCVAGVSARWSDALDPWINVNFEHASLSKSLPLGVWWTAGDDGDNTERLQMVLPSGHQNHLVAKAGHTFAVRSGEQNFVAEVAFGRAMDRNRPFAIKVKNTNSDHPIELKHGESGYVWLDPGQEVIHDTDRDHVFELRDHGRRPIVRAWVSPDANHGSARSYSLGSDDELMS